MAGSLRTCARGKLLVGSTNKTNWQQTNREHRYKYTGEDGRHLEGVETSTKTVLAMELLAACQGIEFFHPLLTTTPLEKVYDLVRSVTKVSQTDQASVPFIKDRFMSPDIDAVHLLLDQKVWNVAQPYIELQYKLSGSSPEC
nr:histidine ammonia-lyase-like [Oncorhynchus nerka]